MPMRFSNERLRMFVVRILASLVVVIASIVSSSQPARADSACLNALPIDTTYADTRWHTGGYQNHGAAPLSDVRAFIRTYNPRVAEYPDPYRGISTLWVMLENNQAWAQVGWAKFSLSPDKFNAYVFSQTSTAAGNVPDGATVWYGRIDPPTSYQYQVSTDRTGSYRYYFNGGLQSIESSTGWVPSYHDVMAEVANFTGDQLPGDRTTEVRAEVIDHAYLGGGWQPTNYTSSGTWIAGYAGSSVPQRVNDLIHIYDGRTFATWDNRCPN